MQRHMRSIDAASTTRSFASSSSSRDTSFASSSSSSYNSRRTRSARNVLRRRRTTQAYSSDMDGGSNSSSSHSSCGHVLHDDDNDDDDKGEHVRVALRVRPPLPRELHDRARPFVAVVDADTTHACVTLSDVLDTPAIESHHHDGSSNRPDDARVRRAEATALVCTRQRFAFDHVYDAHATQQMVYDGCVRPVVRAVLRGYNATVMAYGQTGTGKTYTMEGDALYDTAATNMMTTTTTTIAARRASSPSSSSRGVIARAVEDVFAYMHAHGDRHFRVRVSFLQIYNESLLDLLAPTSTTTPTPPPASSARQQQRPSSSSGYDDDTLLGGSHQHQHANTTTVTATATRVPPLVVRHTPQHGVYVDGLSEWVVRRPRDVYTLLARGSAHRATAATRLSALSSRSHAIFTLVVESSCDDDDDVDDDGDDGDAAAADEAQRRRRYVCGKLHFVDLAGSEKVRRAGVSGVRLRETRSINRSLHELGNVIAALARRDARHVPFRNSQLTSVLRDALGGNGKTTLIACISPALDAYGESLSTLHFAARAQRVRTHAVVNTAPRSPASTHDEQQQQEELAHMQQHYERELAQLRAQLATYKARAPYRRQQQDDEDDDDVLYAVSHVHDDNNCNDDKDDDDDDDEDDVQASRYKQLLLQQRDALIRATARLRERDEVILQLQDEIDAYDAQVQRLEDTLAATTTTPPRPPHDTQQTTAPMAMTTPQDNNNNSNNTNNNTTTTTDEEVRVLRDELSARAEAVALRRYASRHHAAVQQRRVLRARLRVATAKWRAMQDVLDALTRGRSRGDDDDNKDSSSNDSNDASLSMWFAHVDARVSQSLRAARATLSSATARDAALRRRLTCELDRTRFELAQMQSRLTSVYSPAQRAEVSELWRALQLIEDGLLDDDDDDKDDDDDDATSNSDDDDVDDDHTKDGDDARVAVWRRQVTALHATVRQLQQQQLQQQQQQHVTAANGDAHDAAAWRQLQRDVAAHARDRAALQSILQHRVLPKTERIRALATHLSSAAAAANGGHDNDKDERSGSASLRHDSSALEQLLQATRSLHALVAAAVEAMSTR